MTSKDKRGGVDADIVDAEIVDEDGDAGPPVKTAPSKDLVPAEPDDERPEAVRAEAERADQAEEPDEVHPAGRRKPNALLIGAGALALVALVFAAWFGFSWVSAENDDDLALDRTRDEVSRVADAALVTFNTLDFRKVDEGLDRWEAAATGVLYDNIRQGRAASKSTIESAKTITTAKILKSAVTQLNDRDGTAQVMAAMLVERTPDGGRTEPAYLRVQGSLQRTETGWKLNGIATVPFTPAG